MTGVQTCALPISYSMGLFEHDRTVAELILFASLYQYLLGLISEIHLMQFNYLEKTEEGFLLPYGNRFSDLIQDVFTVTKYYLLL